MTRSMNAIRRLLLNAARSAHRFPAMKTLFMAFVVVLVVVVTGCQKQEPEMPAQPPTTNAPAAP